MQWGLAVNWLAHERAIYQKFKTLIYLLGGHTIEANPRIDKGPQTYMFTYLIDLHNSLY